MAQRSRRVVCRTEVLPPGGAVLVPGDRFGVGVFNVNGRHYALANYCPHRGAPLCKGRVIGLAQAGSRPYEITWSRAGEILRCPWHGIEFEIATGRAVVKPAMKAKVYDVRLEGGMVVVEDA
jgi:nitrite reductase (NADH) small subunit